MNYVRSLIAPQRFLNLLATKFSGENPIFFTETEKKIFDVQVYQDMLLDEHNMDAMNQGNTWSENPHGKKKKQAAGAKKTPKQKFKSLFKSTKQEIKDSVFTNTTKSDPKGEIDFIQYGIKLEEDNEEQEDNANSGHHDDELMVKPKNIKKYAFLGYQLSVDRKK